MIADQVLIAVWIALAIVALVFTARKLTYRFRWLSWIHSPTSKRITNVLIYVGLHLVYAWLAGVGFKPILVGAAIVGGLIAAGEYQLVRRAIEFYAQIRDTKK